MKNKNIFLVKFAVVAIAIGIFSPSVSVKPEVKANHGYAAIPMQVDVTLFHTAEARRGGGMRRGGGARRGGNRNVNRNSNRNVNRNVNRNRNVNVNVHHNNRYYGGRHYGYYRGAPLLAFSTALVVGSVIAAATMPTTCTTVVANGISYRRCDNSYYQPFYEGDTLVYKVVTSPY